MSHVVQIETQVRDPVGIAAACHRLKLAEPVEGVAQLYHSERAGWQVRLPGWRYPVVVEVDCGRLHYDHFGGRWGAPVELDRFLQAYAVETAKLAARRQGYAVAEQLLPDGSIRLTVQVGGAA